MARLGRWEGSDVAEDWNDRSCPPVSTGTPESAEHESSRTRAHDSYITPRDATCGAVAVPVGDQRRERFGYTRPTMYSANQIPVRRDKINHPAAARNSKRYGQSPRTHATPSCLCARTRPSTFRSQAKPAPASNAATRTTMHAAHPGCTLRMTTIAPATGITRQSTITKPQTVTVSTRPRERHHLRRPPRQWRPRCQGSVQYLTTRAVNQA